MLLKIHHHRQKTNYKTAVTYPAVVQRNWFTHLKSLLIFVFVTISAYKLGNAFSICF